MINGSYYAVKKVLGKMKGDCLRSESRIAIRNSKFAERKLREWLDGLEREELSPAQPINFCELLDKYRAVNAGKSPKTKGKIEWAINTLRKSWKRGFDVNKRKRVTKEPDPIPSPEQFGKIVEAIGQQRFADHAQDSADLAAFLGLAASAKRRQDNSSGRILTLAGQAFP
jgi:hypothetical protein